MFVSFKTVYYDIYDSPIIVRLTMGEQYFVERLQGHVELRVISQF